MNESAWKPGDKINAPPSEMTVVDPSQVSRKDFYRLMIDTIVPRPIAFVSTVASNGVGNLAPFSFFNGVCSNPPALVLSITAKELGEERVAHKDTLRNILETKQFVVNSANEWLIDPLVHCGTAFPYGVDEMQKVGLTPLASLRVKPARVAESASQFECELMQTVGIGDGPGSATLVIGKILLAHVSNATYSGSRVDIAKSKPIGRLGGTDYASIGTVFSRTVPKPPVE